MGYDGPRAVKGSHASHPATALCDTRAGVATAARCGQKRSTPRWKPPGGAHRSV